MATGKHELSLSISMVLLGAILIGGPIAAARFGAGPELQPNAWVVLVIAYFGILIKSGVAFLIKSEFRWDKFAYDTCGLVLGGTLTCFALQLTSKEDHFPGLNAIRLFDGMLTTLSKAGQHSALLGGMLMITFVGVIYTAIRVKATDDGSASAKRDALASAAGFVLLFAYAILLVAKG